MSKPIDNPWISINDLFDRGLSAGRIATEIERNGIYGWDRYGRFAHFSTEADYKVALDILAEIVADERSGYFGPSNEPEPRNENAWLYGWNQNNLPDFPNINEVKAPVRPKSAVTKSEKSAHKIIAALAYEYDFDISANNKQRVREVLDHMAQLNLDLDEDTVRNHLSAASNFIKSSGT